MKRARKVRPDVHQKTERRYIEHVGNYILDILPESDERAEKVLAYVKEHLHERNSTFPRSSA
ncbi:MAG: hypothetical protein GEU95_10370 [Rhizobiales bacterium]|nr:hypothetical protein [Hyphomicrobiales bacterium]